MGEMPTNLPVIGPIPPECPAKSDRVGTRVRSPGSSNSAMSCHDRHLSIATIYDTWPARS
jgi:hypothetical protein